MNEIFSYNSKELDNNKSKLQKIESDNKSAELVAHESKLIQSRSLQEFLIKLTSNNFLNST